MICSVSTCYTSLPSSESERLTIIRDSAASRRENRLRTATATPEGDNLREVATEHRGETYHVQNYLSDGDEEVSCSNRRWRDGIE
ncbi:MAG: hypothetical protein H0U76_30005 [Ktedonobacteraceae bacterium]|nr:hypothetical protein [Ktedonobacteraceae bacterium]